MIDLKAQAVAVGVRQVRLAEMLGVTEATVSRWLNRKKPIPVEYLWPIALKLDVTLEDLVPRPAPRAKVRRVA
jgi:transcriptional regulator with XRE-family HTH domain